jgi:hypothetical protein
MRTYTITVDETQFVNEPEVVFRAIKGVTSIAVSIEEETIFDPDIYDEDGNFKRIPMGIEGLPVPPKYMEWYIKYSIASGTTTKESFLNKLNQRIPKPKTK